MRRRGTAPITSLLLLVLLGATASEAQEKPGAIARAGLDRFERTLDVPKGRSSSTAIPLTKKGNSFIAFDVELRLIQDQLDSKWAPAMGACVGAANRVPEACIRIAQIDDSDSAVASGSYMPDTGPPFEQTELTDELPVSKTHRIHVSFDGLTVRFELEDGTFFEKTLNVTPEFLRLTCSSARCAVSAIPLP